jgi:hypothetical protein
MTLLRFRAEYQILAWQSATAVDLNLVSGISVARTVTPAASRALNFHPDRCSFDSHTIQCLYPKPTEENALD